IIFAENISEQGLGSEGKIFTQQGIQSALLIPLNFGRETIGLLGIGSHKPASPCQQDTIEAMHMVSIIFVNALMRQKSDERLMAERQRIEATLHTNEQQYKQLVEKATDMIYRINVQGYCTYVNPITIRTMGYTNDKEIIGRHYTEFIHPDFRTMLVNAYHHQQLNQIENSYYEFVAIGKDHKPIWLGQKVQILTEQGQVVGFQALARDITKRRETEEKLRTRSKELNATNAKLAKALRAKDEFLANMSHELRTPLNAVIGYSEMLQEDLREMDYMEFLPDLERIESAGRHLLQLINDILDLSKIEAGQAELFLEWFDVDALVNEVVGLIRPLLDKNNNALEINRSDEIGSVYADQMKVRQCLFNLLSNATKFTENGTVTVALDRLDGQVVFRVSDTGVGMSNEQLGRIFEPFTQADLSTTRKYGGTGLGLSITQRFCEMMGGDISVISKFGEGSTFTMWLPVEVSLTQSLAE
ncbi:MAG: PAS domain S-box protein, partial [Anaerolineales bacterium]|nr:PAS domain S-box protein [Anaerolineales bacterium]